MTRGSQRLAREARVAQDRPQVADVQIRSVAGPAVRTGLTVGRVRDLLALATRWRYPVIRCPGCDLITTQVLLDEAWQGRPLFCCCGCGQARLDV